MGNVRSNFDAVKHALKLSWELRLHPTTPFIPLFRSETGIGKTTMVYDAVNELANEGFFKHNNKAFKNAKVFYINLASMTATDFGGFPYVEKKDKVTVEMVPLNDLGKLLTAEVPTLFFLDEWNRFKDIGILQVLFELLRRRFNGKRMSDLVFFCAAENPADSAEGNYLVMEPDAALIDRVYPIELKKDMLSFHDYILYRTNYDKSLAHALIQLLQEYPKYYDEISNRTLESVLAILSTAYKVGDKLDVSNFEYDLIASKTNMSFAQTLYDIINDLNVSINEIIKEGKISKSKLQQMKPYKQLSLTLTGTDFILNFFEQFVKQIKAKTPNATDNKVISMALDHPYVKNYRKMLEILTDGAKEFMQTLHTYTANVNDKLKSKFIAKVIVSSAEDMLNLLIMYGIDPSIAKSFDDDNDD